MKKIVSWTPTHGNERVFNFKLLKYDTVGQYVRNKCEYIIFSFHNCPDNIYNECVDLVKEIYSMEKLILLRFNNCSYLQCYKNIIQKIVDLNCTHIYKTTDDEYGLNTKENINNLKDIDDIFDYYKNNDIIHLQLGGDYCIPKQNLQPIETIQVNKVLLYKYDTTHFKNCNIYGWTDDAYIIDINIMNNLLHIQNLPNDIWGIELALKNIFDNKNFFYKWGTNKLLFKGSNLMGRNINRKMTPVNNLARFFGETEHWKDIIKLTIETFK